MESNDRLLTVEDLADRYPGVTKASVYAWLHKGTAPPSMKIGRRRLFRLPDVVAWENEQRDQKPAHATA